MEKCRDALVADVETRGRAISNLADFLLEGMRDVTIQMIQHSNALAVVDFFLNSGDQVYFEY